MSQLRTWTTHTLHAVVVLVCLFAFVAPEFVWAQGGGADSGQAANPPAPITLPTGPSGFQSVDAYAGTSFVAPAPPGQTTGTQTGNAAGSTGDGGDTTRVDNRTETPIPQLEEGKGGVMNTIFEIVSGFFALLVGITGTAFDYAINSFIMQFGSLYNTSNLGFTIDHLWGTVRDIFNLTFIFGIVWIGFRMILNADDSNAQRSLGYLLAAALLVNFSLFITKFIVDFSNFAALQVFQAFTGGASISEAFVNAVGMTTTLGDLPKSATNGFGYMFGLILIFLVTSFVFAAGAVLITIRFVALNIYMVLSPIMFLGWVFPGMNAYTQKWWKGFLNKAFFAPAYIFMIYLAFHVIQSYNVDRVRGSGSGQEGLYFSNFWGTEVLAADAAGPFAFFILASAFMLAALVVAQHMGAVGATAAINIGQRMRKSGQSWMGRNTVGRAANRLGELNDRLEGTRAGRNLKRFATVATLGALDERARRNMVNAGKNAKFGGSYSHADDEKFVKERNATRTSEASKRTNSKIMSEGIKALAVDSSSRTTEQQEAVRKLNSLVPTLPKAQIEEMEDKDRNAVAHLFTASQIKDIEKSEKISDASKASFGVARTSAITAKIMTTPAGGGTSYVDPEKLSKLSKPQIEALGSSWLLENAHLLTPSQFEAITKSDSFNEDEINDFKTARNNNFANTLSNLHIPANNRAFSSYLEAIKNKQKEIASLPINALQNPITAGYINSKVIKEIDKDSNITRTDKLAIAALIRGLPPGINTDGKNYLATPKMTDPTQSEWV